MTTCGHRQRSKYGGQGRIRSLSGRRTASKIFDLACGNWLELDWLFGAVVRMGRSLGVETPANGFINTTLNLRAAAADP